MTNSVVCFDSQRSTYSQFLFNWSMFLGKHRICSVQKHLPWETIQNCWCMVFGSDAFLTPSSEKCLPGLNEIPQLSARYCPNSQNHGHLSSESRGVTIYLPAFPSAKYTVLGNTRKLEWETCLRFLCPAQGLNLDQLQYEFDMLHVKLMLDAKLLCHPWRHTKVKGVSKKLRIWNNQQLQNMTKYKWIRFN